MKLLFLIFILASYPLLAQEEHFPIFSESFKGLMSYRQHDTFETVNATEPYTKKSLDFNVFEMTGEYRLSPTTEFEFEIEFEHGGTGSTMEFENLEEFGEFEPEIEKGGEVVISELYYKRKSGENSSIKIGKIPIPISLSNVQTNFFVYSTVLSSAAEGSMIPAEWRELGVQFQQKFENNYNARLLVTSGLNSEFFRSYSWVGTSQQKQFETMNAENLAGTLMLEYGEVATSNGIAVAIYYGETAGNRYKQKKLNDSAQLMIGSLFFNSYFFDNVQIRGQFIRGKLSNSDKVSLANSTLAASVSPKSFSALGHEAQLEMAEISYRFIAGQESTRLFFSYEHVDNMLSVEGSTIKNDRYNQTFSSVGIMHTWDQIFFVKFQHTKHSNALAGLPTIDDYRLAFGFDWYGFNL